MTNIATFLRDDSGATAIEYGLLASLISIVIIAGAKLIGNKIGSAFNTVASALP